MKHFLLAVLLLLTCLPAQAAAPFFPDGLWATKKQEFAIRIDHCGADLCGRIVWLDPATKMVGANGKKLCGTEVLSGFHPAGAGKWSGGTIYRPDVNDTYDGELQRLDDDTLRLHGSLGLSMLGRDKKLHRVSAAGHPDCGKT